jgi:hypothetical protein
MISLPFFPHRPLSSEAMTTIRTYQDNGPYFGATKMSYQAASISDILRHVRIAMEDREDTIAIFDAEGACKGLWQRELEGHVDSAGDSIIDHEGYELMRPKDGWTWNYLLGQVQ